MTRCCKGSDFFYWGHIGLGLFSRFGTYRREAAGVELPQCPAVCLEDGVGEGCLRKNTTFRIQCGFKTSLSFTS